VEKDMTEAALAKHISALVASGDSEQLLKERLGVELGVVTQPYLDTFSEQFIVQLKNGQTFEVRIERKFRDEEERNAEMKIDSMSEPD
jgi:hypothetical protein